jgi:hypothetical protein
VLDDRESGKVTHRRHVEEQAEAAELVLVGDDHIGGGLADDLEYVVVQPCRLVGGDRRSRSLAQVP